MKCFRMETNNMIKCNSPFAYYDKCIIDMDGQQSFGGTICCDTAEDLNFRREDILTHCEYAESENIHDSNLKESL